MPVRLSAEIAVILGSHYKTLFRKLHRYGKD